MRLLAPDLQRDLDAAQSMLDALVRKARDEGYELEIHTRADNDEMLYALAFVRRFHAQPIKPARPTRVK